MYDIQITNSQSHVVIDEPALREIAQSLLEAEHVAGAEISVAVVDNATIRRLNREYLNHDYDTDVLSFLLDCTEPRQSVRSDDQPRGAGKELEGEVVICAEMALQSAGEFEWTPHDELVLYLVHGLLHLVGYDDLSASEKRIMRSREREILQRWGLSPRYDDDADSQSL